jgi:asparagine synthase (glutamine-hydrolysing)
MHENKTLVNEVKQLRAGEYAFLSDNKLQINSYFNLRDIDQTNDSKNTIIETLDFKFKEAIKLEFELDIKHNYRHVTTLSGGLDSRMTALIAHKMGYQNQTLLNFSQKGYADEIIAAEIAKKYHLELIHEDLTAQSLLPLDKVISTNDGQSVYTACSHVFSVLPKYNQAHNGVLHTGMLGDAVMGSYVSEIETRKPRISDGLYSSALMKNAERILNQSKNNYSTEELYKFYNRAFLGVNNGFLFLDLLGETSSPFLNSSFLSYAYSIPRKFKFHERIYIDWIKSLHPEIASFTWESIGGKPTNSEIRRKIYRCRRAIVKRLPIKTMWKNNMNPEQLWYDNDSIVKSTLDSYFTNHIDLLSGYFELRNDVIKLYRTGNITEKALALTLLGAYKLLFNE